MEEIMQLIGNYGFPIVCCVFMFVNNQKYAQSTQEISRTLIEIQKTLEEMRRNGYGKN